MTPLANIRTIRDYAERSKLKPDHRRRNRLIAACLIVVLAGIVGYFWRMW